MLWIELRLHSKQCVIHPGPFHLHQSTQPPIPSCCMSIKSWVCFWSFHTSFNSILMLVTQYTNAMIPSTKNQACRAPCKRSWQSSSLWVRSSQLSSRCRQTPSCHAAAVEVVLSSKQGDLAAVNTIRLNSENFSFGGFICNLCFLYLTVHCFMKSHCLTLWRPMLPYGMGTGIKHPVRDQFVIFDIRALWRSRLRVRWRVHIMDTALFLKTQVGRTCLMKPPLNYNVELKWN